MLDLALDDDAPLHLSFGDDDPGWDPAEPIPLALPEPRSLDDASDDAEAESPLEARMPTRLVEAPPRAKPHDGRYGGHTLVRELVRAPGAVLAEGRDAIGVPWLLQLVRTRPVADDAERLARQHLEHVIAARTAELLDEPALGLRAHGVVDEADGSRTLFWVLPWHPRAPRLAADFAPRPARETVVRVGVVLARRLVERHARGRTEPLLSAALLSFGDGATTPVLLGFPVLVPPVAMADVMVPPLLAPEERLYAQATASGDLWRLGEVLRRLVDACGDEAQALEPLVARLGEAEPGRRFPRASQVLAELEALGAPRDQGAGTTQFSALDPGALSALLLSATADSTTLEAASALEPSSGSVVVRAPDEAATMLADPRNQARADVARTLAQAAARASQQLELEVALGLASDDAPGPTRAEPPPPSAASIALAPFAVELALQGGDTICEVPTRLRLADDATDPDRTGLLRTLVRTRPRPAIERASTERSALDRSLDRVRFEPPVLDRTRARPDAPIPRPSVTAAPTSEETVRIAVVPRPSAVVLRTELRVELGAPAPAEPADEADAFAHHLRSTRRYAAILTVTALLALGLGVVLGIATAG